MEGIQGGIVDVGDEHAFAEIVEHRDPDGTTQSTKSLLVQFGPRARAGTEHQQTDRLATVAEGHHEQPSAPVLAALRIAHHRTRAVINLGLLARLAQDYRMRLRRLRAAQLTHEPLDTLIAVGETGLRDRPARWRR